MTKKRFTLKAYDGIYCDVFDKDVDIAEVHRDDAKGLVDLLNTLHEENQSYKLKVLELINNKIREFENGDYGDLPCNTIHMFLDLKQEIGDFE